MAPSSEHKADADIEEDDDVIEEEDEVKDDGEHYGQELQQQVIEGDGMGQSVEKEGDLVVDEWEKEMNSDEMKRRIASDLRTLGLNLDLASLTVGDGKSSIHSLTLVQGR